mgnify:CR=1 FL=1|jgi:hypothetical protein|tara:strand:- start:156 stop:701 length:546 start_codon:yes stop_codon:yes gene_type:complete
MTKSVTGSFYLTETATIPAASLDGTRITATIDLSAYVNVPTGQAIAVESVDFIWQAQDNFGGALNTFAPADSAWSCQLVDQNPGALFVRADNHSLVASGSLNIDVTANQGSFVSDLYPDNFGPANLSEAFLVVNDTLFLTAGVQGAAATSNVFLTARVRARVVKLSTKDWMAIAIQSTADQ